MKLIIGVFVLSMISVIYCQELRTIDFPNLDNNYRTLEDIIKNPDTLKYYLEQHRKIKNYYYTDTNSYDYTSKLLKDNFSGNYRFIFSELCMQMYDSLLNKNLGLVKLEAEHQVFLASLNTGRRITFTFQRDFNVWSLVSVDVLNPHEMPDPRTYQMRLHEKGIVPNLDSIDNCVLYVKENYQSITKLLNNSDSLYNLLSKVYPNEIMKKKYDNSIAFSDYMKPLKKRFVIKLDELFEADSTHKLENITVFNRILINTDYSTMEAFAFYFMKKNGVWQFYDRKLENYPKFP
jgi:hypothetical protein